MSFGPEGGFDDTSLLFDNSYPTSLIERLSYAKQLIFSRTKLEFRLLWNKVFQKDDEELGWLLSPYRQSTSSHQEATMMSSFNKNDDQSYHYDRHDIHNVFGREKVTIYQRGVARKGDNRGKTREESKTLAQSALDLARYMGMGVYMTSTAFPSPFYPVNDHYIYDETVYEYRNYNHSMSRIY